MSKLIAIAAILASALALPVMAQNTSGNEKAGPAAAANEAVAPVETIIVTARADPSFAKDCAGEGYCTFEFTQYAYDRVDGKWASVDNLGHPDYPIAQVAAADMELQYPGA